MYNIQKEIEKNISKFHKIGLDEFGGVTRLLYDQNWLEAQNELLKEFQKAGLASHYDEVGNVFGRLEGSLYKDEIVASGSHIDTVKRGGKLDGLYGIVGAFVAVEYLYKTYGQPLRTIEIVSFAEEEGSRFPFVYWGSKNYLDLITEKDRNEIELLTDKDGACFVDAMESMGFHFKEHCTEKKLKAKAFLELHIEQGNVLEKTENSLGIVDAIAGQRRYNIIITGEANHAGTTPMCFRKDAIYCFSKICTQSIEQANQVGEPLVLTFGKVVPFPNTVNVVPGKVEFTIDCRHPDTGALKEFTEKMEQSISDICKEMGMDVEIDRWMDAKAVPMDRELVSFMETIVKKEGLPYKMMHSGAGHDSQVIAPHVPTVMLFVPSINGISHNPLEDTSIEDLVNGVRVLASAFYELAYQ